MVDYKDGGTQLISWNAMVSSASHWLSPASAGGFWLVNGDVATRTRLEEENNSFLNHAHNALYCIPALLI